jgi:hypothetical protein
MICEDATYGTNDLKSRRDCACTPTYMYRWDVVPWKCSQTKYSDYSRYRMTDDQHATGGGLHFRIGQLASVLFRFMGM